MADLKDEVRWGNSVLGIDEHRIGLPTLRMERATPEQVVDFLFPDMDLNPSPVLRPEDEVDPPMWT